MKKSKFLILMLFVHLFISCTFLKTPSGTVELISSDIYKNGIYKYCTVYFQIKNTSETDIYSSVISIQISTSKERLKTNLFTSSTIIPPKKSITESCTFSFIDESENSDIAAPDNTINTENEEEWLPESIKIIDYYFK